MGHKSLNAYAAYRPDVAVDRRAEKKVPFRVFGRLLDTLECWHQRNRQRTALSELDDRLLKDVGLTGADVAREVRKSFWQR